MPSAALNFIGVNADVNRSAGVDEVNFRSQRRSLRSDSWIVSIIRISRIAVSLSRAVGGFVVQVEFRTEGLGNHNRNLNRMPACIAFSVDVRLMNGNFRFAIRTEVDSGVIAFLCYNDNLITAVGQVLARHGVRGENVEPFDILSRKQFFAAVADAQVKHAGVNRNTIARARCRHLDAGKRIDRVGKVLRQFFHRIGDGRIEVDVNLRRVGRNHIRNVRQDKVVCYRDAVCVVGSVVGNVNVAAFQRNVVLVEEFKRERLLVDRNVCIGRVVFRNGSDSLRIRAQIQVGFFQRMERRAVVFLEPLNYSVFIDRTVCNERRCKFRGQVFNVEDLTNDVRSGNQIVKLVVSERICNSN